MHLFYYYKYIRTEKIENITHLFIAKTNNLNNININIEKKKTIKLR